MARRVRTRLPASRRPDPSAAACALSSSGPNPGLMKTVLFGSSTLTINEFDTRSGASFGHSAALGGLGVGAVHYQETPRFGQDPPLIEDFSSVGGIPILFDTAGCAPSDARRSQPNRAPVRGARPAGQPA